MSYFRCPGMCACGVPTTLGGDVARHITQSQRLKVGDEITIQDEMRNRFRARITHTSRGSVTLEPLEPMPLPPMPRIRIVLCQALIAEQKLDLVIQKATELGVSHIVIFPSARAPQQLKAERMEHKRTRWQAIMESACEQSGRPDTPELTIVATLENAVHAAEGNVFLLEEGAAPLHAPANTATLFVGPEGGFTDTEKQVLLTLAGASTGSIGTYTLRAETAAIAGIARFV